jgi:hypothetical protein
MQDIESKTDKLYEYVAKLPVACEPFLWRLALNCL